MHKLEKNCECGNDTFNVFKDLKHCCVNISQTHGEQCMKDGNNNVRCDQGTPLSMSTPCNEICYNDYAGTAPMGLRARYKCGSEHCVLVHNMCRGYSLCSDGSDTEECSKGLKCHWQPQGTGGHSVEKLPSGHHFCHYYADDNNGIYDTIGRFDEEVSVSEQQSNVDYNSLVPCRDQYNTTGLQCGHECWPHYFWCRVDGSFICSTNNMQDNTTTSFSNSDPMLCGNFTFWSKPENNCTHFFEDGVTISGHGERCTGTRQHCYWPWYTRHDAKVGNTRHSTCDDHSDQIFQTNSTCKTKKYIEEYRYLFCQGPSKASACANVQSLVDQAIRSRNMKILDPHNCTGSCAWPGLGCEACTNPEYTICTRNNIEVCLHPQLVCDGHQHCDNGEDEKNCLETYEIKGIIEPYATFICKNAMYPDILTVGSACNGIVECHDGIDELVDRCDGKETTGLVITSVSVLSIYFLLRVLGKIFKTGRGWRRRRNSFQVIARIDPEELLKEYEENHDDPYVLQKINIYFLHVHFFKTKILREDVTLKLYSLEERIHKTKPVIFSCLKHRISDIVSKMVIDDKFPRFVDRYCCCFQIIVEKLNYFHKIIALTKKILGILSHYSDIFTDVFLMITMFMAVGGLDGVRSFPDRFTSVVILSSGVTILFPLLIGSLHLAINNPGLIFNRGFQINPKRLNLLMAAGVIITSALNPILLRVMYETIKEKMRREAKFARNLKVLYLYEKFQTVKKHHAKFVWIEMGLETCYQAAGQILLLLLSKTRTPTTGGFEAMFQTDTLFFVSADTFLIVSVIMSLRSCIFKNVRAISTENTNLSFKAKLILFLWSTAATLRRILAIVTCFVPSMGLLHTLHHWRAEQIPFWIRKDRADKNLLKSTDTLALYNMTERVLWTDIDRWNFTSPSSPQPPDYTLYTGLSLGNTFSFFLCLTALHFVCITILKIFIVKNLGENNYFNVFVHSLQNLNLPVPLEDWSQGTWSLKEYQKRFQRQNLEMWICYSLNLVVTIMLLVPLWWTGRLLNIFLFTYLTNPSSIFNI